MTNSDIPSYKQIKAFTLPSFDNSEDSEQQEPELAENTLPNYGGDEDTEAEDYQTEEFEEIHKPRSRVLSTFDSAEEFEESEFQQEEGLFTNLEKYSKEVHAGIDQYKEETESEINFKRNEIEQELVLAKTVRKEAEEEAQKIIQTAVEQASQISQNAQQEGYQKGLEEGRAQAVEETESHIEHLKGILTDLNTLRTYLYAQHEQEVAELSLIFARKIVGNELKTNPDIVLAIIKKNLSRFEGQGSIKIRINPIEYDFLINHKSELSPYLDEGQIVVIKADPEIEIASPIIESDFSVVNTSIQAQFEKVDLEIRECIIERQLLFDKIANQED
ncbi:MAG: flagellar assembly protein FliH [bacterium]|jgi:flagellar assembly protein FliH